MDYTLCKKLKELGFSQEGLSGYKIPDGKHKFDLTMATWSQEMYDMAGINKSDVLSFDEYQMSKAYDPTLSELIKACGNVILFDVDKKWVAAQNYVDANSYGGHYIDGAIEKPQNGSTPEEAVAKLWLALQTNK